MTAPVAAGIYCRISLAGMGDTTKTDDQERICRELGTRLGWPIIDVYCDNSVSAWQPNRKRKDWDRMTADAESGRINALIVYHGDRLIRRPEDLYTLLRWARTRGFKLASPTGERDLGNPDDEFILWIEAAMANRESANTSRRRKAQYERWRREGKVRPGGRGGRAYGFDTKNSVLPHEADYVRQAADMILAGDGAGGVARWLNGCYQSTPARRPFTHGTVTKMLRRARYAGLMPDGVSPAAWEPILERETWEAVSALLGSRAAGYGYATNARRYLLSGIARCGLPECGKPMQIWQSKGRTGTYMLGYRCSGCRRLFRSQPHLDAYVAGRVVQRLSHAENPAARVPQAPGLAAEFRALTDARAEAAAAVEDPANPHVTLLLTRLKRIEERLAELREMAGDSARERLIRQHAGITDDEFDAAPLSVRRALVAACFEVTVLPASARGPGFRPEDVRLTPLGYS